MVPAAAGWVLVGFGAAMLQPGMREKREACPRAPHVLACVSDAGCNAGGLGLCVPKALICGGGVIAVSGCSGGSELYQLPLAFFSLFLTKIPVAGRTELEVLRVGCARSTAGGLRSRKGAERLALSLQASDLRS